MNARVAAGGAPRPRSRPGIFQTRLDGFAAPLLVLGVCGVGGSRDALGHLPPLATELFFGVGVGLALMMEIVLCEQMVLSGRGGSGGPGKIGGWRRISLLVLVGLILMGVMGGPVAGAGGV